MLKVRTLIILLIAGAGLWQAASGVWIHAKAGLAQVLLESAWEKTLAGNARARPWPWADTWPVARLRIPSRDINVIVLQGDSGRSLAFAPGMAAGSALPGQPGTTLISAHRDTHFKNIADIQPGEQIELETRHGRRAYRVLYTDVVDARHSGITSDPLRDELVPINRRYPIAKLLDACWRYASAYSSRQVTFEYVMLDGVNDGREHADRLIRLLRNRPAKVNLIPFNPFPGSHYRSSSPERVEAFRMRLKRSGLIATTRKTRGDDIDAACGQLVGKVRDKSKRQLRNMRAGAMR